MSRSPRIPGANVRSEPALNAMTHETEQFFRDPANLPFTNVGLEIQAMSA